MNSTLHLLAPLAPHKLLEIQHLHWDKPLITEEAIHLRCAPENHVKLPLSLSPHTFSLEQEINIELINNKPIHEFTGNFSCRWQLLFSGLQGKDSPSFSTQVF